MVTLRRLNDFVRSEVSTGLVMRSHLSASCGQTDLSARATVTPPNG
jgi:hypothetical protein